MAALDSPVALPRRACVSSGCGARRPRVAFWGHSRPAVGSGGGHLTLKLRCGGREGGVGGGGGGGGGGSLPPTVVVPKGPIEDLWQEFFQDFSPRWHRRTEQRRTREALWLNSRLDPPWLEFELAAVLSGLARFNLFTWNRRLVASSKAGQYKATLELYRRMRGAGVGQDRYTFVPVLNACAALKDLDEGRRVHEQSRRSDCEADLFVGNSLVDMYTKCGSIDDAWAVFSNMPVRDVVSWNVMIQGYAKRGQGRTALDLGQRMRAEGVEPGPVTFVALLNACAGLREIEEGRAVHEEIVRRGCATNVYVCNSLVDMYAKCGSMRDAWKTFSAMPMRNVVGWSAMIQGYVLGGQGQRALNLYARMQQEGVQPNRVTFVAALNACAALEALDEGRLIHKQIIAHGCGSETFVANTLVDMYAKCGSMDEARRAFRAMPERSAVSWNAMISGLAKWGFGHEALELFERMRGEGLQPTPVTFVGLLRACITIAGGQQEGRDAHEQTSLARRGRAEAGDFVVKCVADMTANGGSITHAWKLLSEADRDSKLRRVGRAEKASSGGAASGAAALALERGRRVHEEIVRAGRAFEADVFVGTCLVDMYCKCGSVEEAWSVFSEMPTRTVVTWSTMIHGFLKCGQGQRAVELSRQMEQEVVEPDEFTYVGVLNACASVAAVGEGRRVHGRIVRRGWETDGFVGASLVDMYARCGSIEDAFNVFSRMPKRNLLAWGAVILGYMKCGQRRTALELSRRMRDEADERDVILFAGALDAVGGSRRDVGNGDQRGGGVRQPAIRSRMSA